jgi:hypothetical protein
MFVKNKFVPIASGQPATGPPGRVGRRGRPASRYADDHHQARHDRLAPIIVRLSLAFPMRITGDSYEIHRKSVKERKQIH